MAKCEICGKGRQRASKLSYRSSQMTKRTLTCQEPNIQKVSVIENGNSVKKHVCTKCLKSKVERA